MYETCPLRANGLNEGKGLFYIKVSFMRFKADTIDNEEIKLLLFKKLKRLSGDIVAIDQISKFSLAKTQRFPVSVGKEKEVEGFF